MAWHGPGHTDPAPHPHGGQEFSGATGPCHMPHAGRPTDSPGKSRCCQHQTTGGRALRGFQTPPTRRSDSWSPSIPSTRSVQRVRALPPWKASLSGHVCPFPGCSCSSSCFCAFPHTVSLRNTQAFAPFLSLLIKGLSFPKHSERLPPNSPLQPTQWPLHPLPASCCVPQGWGETLTCLT